LFFDDGFAEDAERRPSGSGRGRTILRRASALLASSSRVECRFLDDDEADLAQRSTCVIVHVGNLYA
jgi:hypothetical protein